MGDDFPRNVNILLIFSSVFRFGSIFLQDIVGLSSLKKCFAFLIMLSFEIVDNVYSQKKYIWHMTLLIILDDTIQKLKIKNLFVEIAQKLWVHMRKKFTVFTCEVRKMRVGVSTQTLPYEYLIALSRDERCLP